MLESIGLHWFEKMAKVLGEGNLNPKRNAEGTIVRTYESSKMAITIHRASPLFTTRDAKFILLINIILLVS
jgi:hypothetical protein